MRLGLLLIKLPLVNEPLHHSARDAPPPLADAIAEFGNSWRLQTARAVDGLGRNIVFRHDAGIFAHEVQLGYIFKEAGPGGENEATPIRQEKLIGMLGRFGFGFLLRDQHPVPVGQLHLHIGNACARRGAAAYWTGSLVIRANSHNPSSSHWPAINEFCPSTCSRPNRVVVLSLNKMRP